MSETNNLVSVQDQLITDLPSIESILPSHVTPDAFIRAASIAIISSPKLQEASRDSVIMALSKCAGHGLIPDNREAALVPFNCKEGNSWVTKVQYMPMIDGILKRARMSGEIKTIASKAVYENDEFDYWIDEDGEHMKFRPVHSDRGDIKLCFAFAKLNNGEMLIEVMTKDEIDKVRNASKAKDSPAWKDWYDRMGCKSVTHRIARRLPNASEIMQMIETGLNVEFEKKNAPVDITPVSEKLDIFLDDDGFKKRLPKWTKAIESGKSADDLIATVETKTKLTDEQKKELKAIVSTQK